MSAPPVLVCVPAFRGAEMIGETLRCIARQGIPNLSVHISVDGGDAETAEACRPFLADPRFRLTVQERRLGWAGNLNALWAEAREGYAMYWQQDDLADDRYLERLLAAAEASPFAAVAYADVQWFGARSEREEFPSVTGAALARALFMARAQHYLPFRGLVRASALREAGLLRITPYDSALEDLVQVTRFARVGELLRVPGPIYLKRAHRAAVHRAHLATPRAVRRGVGLLYAAGMLAAVLPAARDEAEARRVGRSLLPRFLALPPASAARAAVRAAVRALPGGRRLLGLLRARRRATFEPPRWLHYDPAAEAPWDSPRFAAEALRAAAAACGAASGAALLGPAPLSAADPDEALLAEALRREAWREAFRARLAREGEARVVLAEDPGADALLSGGWSLPESWGTWSDGPEALLDLPLPEGRWRVELRLRGFGAGGPPRVVVTEDGAVLAEARIGAEETLRVVVAGGGRLALLLPDAASPASLGLGEDGRQLSAGLLALSVARG
jgi:hypothetical protein